MTGICVYGLTYIIDVKNIALTQRQKKGEAPGVHSTKVHLKKEKDKRGRTHKSAGIFLHLFQASVSAQGGEAIAH